MNSRNAFLNLTYEPAFESLGDRFYEVVDAADFPKYVLRFRNNDVLALLGLDPYEVPGDDFVEAFGMFNGVGPFLAMAYHGYQFGEYNPHLGDGRGFLYGQVRGLDGELYDFGTKGSGTTPFSRGGDGRLTLKGGVREVLASEMLHRLGVRTSRCLSLIETGEQLWRGDEPSPTRSSVMVRWSRSHIRFGTFERLRYLRRPDLIELLLDNVIDWYYSHLVVPSVEDSRAAKQEIYGAFYCELVHRVADLTAQWMVAGFCHAVLNTDNMSITGESFDYGPYAFIPTYDPKFTAAYFDYYGRYSYSNQPLVGKLNLEMLQAPLAAVMAKSQMEEGLAQFDEIYYRAYEKYLLRRLGFDSLPAEDTRELCQVTVTLLSKNDVGYHDFFIQLREQFDRDWRENLDRIFPEAEPSKILKPWRQIYHRILQHFSDRELDEVGDRLRKYNAKVSLVRPNIEAVWEPIVAEDNWEPFYQLLREIRE